MKKVKVIFDSTRSCEAYIKLALRLFPVAAAPAVGRTDERTDAKTDGSIDGTIDGNEHVRRLRLNSGQRSEHGNRPRITIGMMIILVAVLVWPPVSSGQDSPADLSGFEPSEIFEVKDGGKIEAGNAVLTRLLHRVFQVSERSMRRFSRHTESASLSDVCNSPRDYRFYCFTISGVATEFKTSPGDDYDDAFNGFDLLHVTDSAGEECLVALPIVSDEQQAKALPTNWEAGEILDQPIELVGFFLGLRNFETSDGLQNAGVAAPDSLSNKLNPPVFVARRINWFPNRTSQKLAINESDLLLAEHGVDFNQLHQLGNRVSNGIGVDEAMSFYQLLKTTSQLDANEIPRSEIDLETMLRDPAECLAKPMSITGHIKRVTEIPVEDEEVRNRLGIDKYYQLDMFVPLGNRRIVIKPPGNKSHQSKSDAGSTGADQTRNLIIENRFPITVCTCSLPIDKADINRDRVTVRGFFFKNWSYESELSIENQSGAQQISPLIIATQPEIVPLGPNYFGVLLTAFAVAVIGSAILLAWFLRPGISSGSQRVQPERIEVPNID